MSTKAKFKKLKRDPKAFFRDSKLFSILNESKKTESVVINNKESKKSKLAVSKNKVSKKVEPSVIAKISHTDNNFLIDYYAKKVINSFLGFSTLCVVPNNNDYLINQRFFNKVIKDKNFIAFREKSVYFILEELKAHNSGSFHQKSNFFNLFVKNKELRSNLFKDFRNIVVFNPTSESFAVIRQSSPFLVSICVVDSQSSLDFLKNYMEHIDVLISYDHFDLTAFRNIPRILTRKIHNFNFNPSESANILYPYKNAYKSIKNLYDNDLFEMLKTALVDSSYKRDCNLLLPIFCTTNNLNEIDLLNNDHTIQGLIKFKLNESATYNNLNTMVESIEIQELYLRDNLYCLYKDLILSAQKSDNYIPLLKKTLLDGVYYEKI